MLVGIYCSIFLGVAVTCYNISYILYIVMLITLMYPPDGRFCICLETSIWCYFAIPAHHIHHVSQTSNTQADFSWNLATMFRQRFKLVPISTSDACVACLSQRTGLWIAILWMSCLASPDQMTKDYFSILPLNEAKVKAGSHQTPTKHHQTLPIWISMLNR